MAPKVVGRTVQVPNFGNMWPVMQLGWCHDCNNDETWKSSQEGSALKCFFVFLVWHGQIESSKVFSPRQTLRPIFGHRARGTWHRFSHGTRRRLQSEFGFWWVTLGTSFLGMNPSWKSHGNTGCSKKEQKWTEHFFHNMLSPAWFGTKNEPPTSCAGIGATLWLYPKMPPFICCLGNDFRWWTYCD